MKNFLIAVVIIGAIAWFGRGYISGYFNPKADPNTVYVGEPLEDVEKLLGQPTQVLPNEGRELRKYPPHDGHNYTILYEMGKVDEIHMDE
jgi:hypothetical protein